MNPGHLKSFLNDDDHGADRSKTGFVITNSSLGT